MKKVLIIILICLSPLGLLAQRIKDVSFFKGSTSEQLIGYGLVVGLAGTGDSYRSTFTVQSVVSMLKRFGITVPDVNLRTKNIAAVMVTANVNSYLKSGSKFDVNVSSMGDATSLMGGTLLMSPLSGRDAVLYALSQGPVSIGGYDVNTSSGGRVAKNHALSGRIPGGGILEKELPTFELDSLEVQIILNSPDYTTANNIVSAINQQIGQDAALAVDASEIKVKIPTDKQNNIPQFLAQLEAIQVQTDVVAKVVLNEKTGTVVAGSNVKILPVTISHGSLKINIKSYPMISQPGAFSGGNTTLFNNLVPSVEKENSNVVSINGASNVQEVAAALNSLKVTPRDIIAIFQAIKEAGALQAELVII
ncbi:MAG: flagellar basal body P-ring protein FlgI [Ignavibacteriales bacterium]|nr:MAG: flagellar basal body P-ring protein FlgI [Ignavibacteriales bacterium]